jgi:far upstream element-binding protein
MQTQTGAHIQIAKETEMKPGDTHRRVTLRGAEANVRDLKQRVEETVTSKTNGGRPGVGMSAGPKEHNKELDTAFVLKVVIPNDKVGLIIGKGGVTVKMIQDRTNSNIQIPSTADEDNAAVRTLSIGAETREAVEACQMEIFNLLQTQQQQQASMGGHGQYGQGQGQGQGQGAPYGQGQGGGGGYSSYQAPAAYTMTIPDDRVGIVIGKSGATIKDLQNRHGCRIQIPGFADVGSVPPIRTVRCAS